MANLAGGLVERGIATDLILSSAAGEFLAHLSPKVKIIDLRSSKVSTSLLALIRYLRRERPSAMLSALDHANIVAILAKIVSGVSTRVIVSVHAPLSLSFQIQRALMGRLLPLLVRLLYPYASEVVAVSQGIKQELIDHIGLNPARVHKIYNPIIDGQLRKLGDDGVDHSWFTGQQPPVIVGVGRLSAEKDYATLIRAFHRVRRLRSVRLLILGEGPERVTLEALIRERNLEDDVQLAGFVRNPYAYMRRAACFVSPSRFEGFGNVIVEALAVGCPVVSTACPTGPTEILEGGKWGLLVKVGDDEDMAAAILSTLETKLAPSRASLNAYLERFSLVEVTKEYLDVIGVPIEPAADV